MDGNDTLRNVAISAAVFFLILWAWPKLLPMPQRSADSAIPPGTADAVTSPVEPAAGGPDDTGDAPGDSAAALEISKTPAGTVNANGLVAIEAAAEQTLYMGSAPTGAFDKKASPDPYRMSLEVSNVGASIVQATMTDHAESLNSKQRYRLLGPVEREDGTRYRSLAVEKINIDGTDVHLDDKKWHVGAIAPFDRDGLAGQRVVFRIEVHAAGDPVVRLTRTFELLEQALELGRHDLGSTLVVESLSQVAHQVFVTYRGGIGVPQVNPRFDDRYVDSGLWDGTRVIGTRVGHAAVSRDPQLRSELFAPQRTEPMQRLSWAATANTYFTATVAPLSRNGTDNAPYLADVSAVDLDHSAATVDDVTVRFVTRAEVLPVAGALEYPADLYIGEKDADAFRSIEEYKRRNYYFQISKGFGSCTFSFLVELMIWLLNSIHYLTRDYGLAIIAVVLVVRSLLHPITKKGQINMFRMQKMQGEMAPKMEELKKKFSNDKSKLQQETMKLYREQGINPATQMMSCLPMFLQMPIWIALFLSLSNNIQLRHQGFFLFPWIHDLTAQDALITFSSPLVVPLLGFRLPSFNLLPLLVALLMFIQQKLQPKPKPNPNLSQQQRQQQDMMQKMMPMMSIMMLVFFYKMPSGLNLYIMFSSLFGAIEQHRIRKHIKEQEAAGTLYKPRAPIPERPHKPSKIKAYLEKLQAAAEKAQKDQPRRPAKGKARR